jgi:hypothetical protein
MARKSLKAEFEVTDGQLFDLVIKAAMHCGYTLLNQSRRDGTLTFKTGITWTSWSGVEVSALVAATTPGKAEVMFGGGTAAAAGTRPKQLVVIGGAKGPAKKITAEIKSLIKKGEIPATRALEDRGQAVSTADELAKLAKLKQDGVVTAAEFDAAKAKLLAG